MTAVSDGFGVAPSGRRRAFGVIAVVLAAIIVLGSVAAGVVTWSQATSRTDANVDRYARAAVGCTTTLDFEVTGTFYVFEERGVAAAALPAGCDPSAEPGAEFLVELSRDGRQVAVRSDRSLRYEADGSTGTSIGRFVIDRPGRYEMTVIGSEPDILVAIGRDPQRGSDALRVLALALVGAGLVVSGALIAGAATSSARRSGGADGLEATVVGGGPWGPPSGPPLG